MSPSVFLVILPWMVMGGAERFTLNLIDQLAERDWQVCVVCTSPSENEWKPEFEKRVSDIVVLPGYLPVKDYPGFIKYYIAQWAFDAVLIEGSLEGYRLLPTLRALFPNLPILDYLHFVTPDWMDGGFPRLSTIYHDAIDLTVTSCQQVKDWMIDQGSEEDRLVVCPIGVDTYLWQPDSLARRQLRNMLGIAENEAVIVYAGRLEDQKQPLLFAETMYRLSQSGAAFQALMAGNGSLRVELEQYIRVHQLDRLITLLGSVPASEMPRLLAAADICFLPSKNEGISSLVYEAMASGLPIVGANVGGQAELVTPECGILLPNCPPGEQLVAYTNALADLISNAPKRSRMGAASRERITSAYTLDHMGVCMQEILTRAVEEKQNNKLTHRHLSREESLSRDTQHVVEYLQARQEWHNLHLDYDELAQKYSLFLQHKPSHWFYLWIRQLMLPIFARSPGKGGSKLLLVMQKKLKRLLLKD